MSDFSIRIGVDDEDTDVRPIGGAIAELSAAKHAIVQAGGQIVTSHDIQSNWASWPHSQQVNVEKIYDAMSIDTYDDENALKSTIARGNGGQVQQEISLLFVFEEEGQMIVPISNHRDITRGLEQPPMNFLDTYDSARKTPIGTAALDEFAALVSGIAGLDEVNGAKVIDAFKQVFGIGEEDTETDEAKVETFYTQLGEYNMRQCL